MNATFTGLRFDGGDRPNPNQQDCDADSDKSYLMRRKLGELGVEYQAICEESRTRCSATEESAIEHVTYRKC